ncbi:hypothetical protein ZHAS_00016878 [Anopheles sinensis]|uniref:Uncharacterized protein n=1 Tax=Anopheles sinensis TaxID=74873 RepID=A0A084WEC1_ANOSI|nr:hypothetical protein ZHAS_00016878 [Anopheles sinensis]
MFVKVSPVVPICVSHPGHVFQRRSGAFGSRMEKRDFYYYDFCPEPEPQLMAGSWVG